MQIPYATLLAVLAYSSSVTAAPSYGCSANDAVIKLLRGPLKYQAPAFCSAYLHYPKTKTVTRSVTTTKPGKTVSTTLPNQTSHQTVTETDIATATDDVTSTTTATSLDTTVYTTISTTFETSDQTIYTTQTNTAIITDPVNAPDPIVTTTETFTAGTKTIYQRREAEASPAPNYGYGYGLPVPKQLGYYPGSRISSACSCIVRPSTKTVTKTIHATTSKKPITQTVSGTVISLTETSDVTSTSTETDFFTVTSTQTSTQTLTSSVLETSTVTETDLETSQVTTTVQTTVTLPPTGTSTTTFATTVTPILVKPKICNAKGLPGANAFNYDANFNTDQASCIASCKTDARCLSTGFYLVTDPTTGSTTGTCRKYDKSVTDSADLGFGYYNFNDKAC